DARAAYTPAPPPPPPSRRSVHAAHAVDGDLLDQQLLGLRDVLGLGGDLGRGLGAGVVCAHERPPPVSPPRAPGLGGMITGNMLPYRASQCHSLPRAFAPDRKNDPGRRA